MQIYTRTGDDGSTGLLYGLRVPKWSTGPEAAGTVDELVAQLGVARALASDDALLLELQRDLFVVGAEISAAPDRRDRLEPNTTLVTVDMWKKLEVSIDRAVSERPLPDYFVVPGANAAAAALDLARAVCRRAERRALSHLNEIGVSDSQVGVYLNRLSDLLFVLARASEDSWTPWHAKE